MNPASLGKFGLPVAETVVARTAFYSIIGLAGGGAGNGPRVLVVCPLSGHRPVLLRDMLAALIPQHTVFLMEWTDAAEVPAALGPFGLDENIESVIEAVRRLGPDVHLVAVSQSPLPSLAAAALLAAGGEALQPRSLTLISGFLDPGLNPTRVGLLADSLPLGWLAATVLTSVPGGRSGAGRLVYPALTQGTALGVYLARHLAEGGELFRKVFHDDGLDPIGYPFLRLYFDLQDLPGELFVDTIDKVFQRRLLARGRLSWRGIRIAPEAISRTALLTVEGARDDSSGRGQTAVAHEFCWNIPWHLRAHHVEPGVGHFGTFHGLAWRRHIAPLVIRFIRTAA